MHNASLLWRPLVAAKCTKKLFIESLTVTVLSFHSLHCKERSAIQHKPFILYLNSNLSAATVFTEDICGDAFEDFTKRSAAKKHGQFDLVASKMLQRRHVFYG